MTGPRVFPDLEAFAAAVGEPLGTGPWHEVTQEQVNLFADATGDHQWIHVDVERAKDGPFGGPIAHGYLTLSLLIPLWTEILVIEEIDMAVNYGLNKVRFPQPVKVGSRIRAHAELLSVTPGSGGSRAVVRWTIEIENVEKPACVAETVALLVP